MTVVNDEIGTEFNPLPLPPSAFPWFDGQRGSGGMDLRDFFAALAIAGQVWDGYDGPVKEVAKRAYVLADAMMEARKISNKVNKDPKLDTIQDWDRALGG